MKTMDMEVIDAGYFYMGHFRRGEIRIVLGLPHCGVTIYQPLRSDAMLNLYKLFDVFDIDCEDGKYLQAITGKYCRAMFDDNDVVTGLQHITKDGIMWHIDERGTNK